jgi:DNA polymerase-3 subunit alpha
MINLLKYLRNELTRRIKKRGIDKFPAKKRASYFNRIKEELDTYIKLDAVDYMLLQKKIIDWCHGNGIFQGYGRGSVNGSLIAYVLGITEMDSIKHKLNFFRFLNPERISLPDIDIDFPPTRRQDVIDFMASLDGIDFAEIITFNTKALKGAIRLVGKGLDMDLDEVDAIAKAVETHQGKDHIDEKWKKQYPELFMYVELLNGVIESMGSHPSGFVVSPIDLATNVSTVYTKESTYKVTAVNMKELDANNYVKLDVLGLDNIEMINEACISAGIERLTPDNIDITDMNVWKSLRESTLGVFQFESESAYNYLKQLFSDETLEYINSTVGDVDYIDLLSMANGAIRPSGDSYRYQLAQGISKDNGHPALNEALKPTLGYLIFQEQIMKFLTDFASHSGAESDSVRRGLSKKEGTEQFLPKIHDGFISYMKEHYNESKEHAEEILQSFLKVIDDASRYGFSVNHSQPYSYIGYIGAWLRYYYPLEYLTTYLNMQESDKERTMKIINYAKTRSIEIKPIIFGGSRAKYSFDKEENVIYKGISSIKFLNTRVAEELYILAHEKDYGNDWISLVSDIFKTSCDTRQMEILIRLDFFKEFGVKEVLLEVFLCMADKKKADTIMYPEFAPQEIIVEKKKRSGEISRSVKTVKRPLKFEHKLSDKSKLERLDNLYAYHKAVVDNPPRKIELHEQIAFERDNLGYAVSTFHNVHSSFALVTKIDNIKYTPKVSLYRIKTGEEFVVKVNKKLFWENDEQMLFIGDVISVVDAGYEDGWKNDNGAWKRNPNVQELHLYKCRLVRKSVLRYEK